MARALTLFLLLGSATAASWQSSSHEAAHKLGVSQEEASPVLFWAEQKNPSAGCIPDLPGGRVMAGATMFGSIALTAGITIAMMYYVLSKRAPALPLAGPSAPAAPANDGPPSVGDQEAGSVKSAAPKKKRIYMYTLDGMRTILVTCVILAHYPLGLPSICKHFLGWPMQFFFVLSGFVAQVQQEAGTDFGLVSGCLYVTRRLARILPMYQLALVFQYALTVYGNRDCQPVAAWPMNALCLQVFFPVRICGELDWAWTLGYTHFNGNGPAWFAACIIWFSCLFPLLYNCRPRTGGMWLFGLLVALIACRAVPDLVSPKWGSYGGGPHLYAMSPIRLMEYMAGMWAAQVAAEVAGRWHSWNCWCWLFDASLVLLVGMIYVSIVVLGSTWTCSGDYHLVAICCLVCFTARLAAEMPEETRQGLKGAVLHRIIGSTPLSYVARFSFGAYIFQTSFMGFTEGGQDFYFHRFCLLWAFAIFATIYMEEPIIAAMQARLKA